MQSTFWRLVVMIQMVYFGFSGNIATQAYTRQATAFLSSFRNSESDVLVWRKGLESVSSIEFEPHAIASYQISKNQMKLDLRMKNTEGNLRRFNELFSVDLGSLAHESFHSFKSNFMDADPNYSNERAWFQTRAKIVYSEVPVSKRAVALEEAYAFFIGTAVLMKLELNKMIAKGVGADNCSERLNSAARLWKNVWDGKIQGYYYRDSVAEVLNDRADDLFILLKDGQKAYEDHARRDQQVFVRQDLPIVDRRWISKSLLDSRWSESFQNSFSDQIREVGCLPAPEFK